jgi:hypothetical protein
LPAYSVAPQIGRLQNGVLALSTGRPGLFLWFAAEARGRDWQAFDVLAHHNAALDPRVHLQADHTTAYTALVEVADNRIFLVYDRTPSGWQPVPADSGQRSQIYLLEVHVQRV